MRELDERVNELSTLVAAHSAKVDDILRQTTELREARAQNLELGNATDGLISIDRQINANITSLVLSNQRIQTLIEHANSLKEQINRDIALQEEELNRFWKMIAAAVAALAVAVFAIFII
jgi:chromosome segregation ATPase